MNVHVCICMCVCTFILVKLVYTHTHICVYAHTYIIYQFSRTTYANCRNSGKHFVLAKINGLLNSGPTSRHPGTTASSKEDNSDSRLCFSNKNELNVFAARLCGLCQILHLLKVSFNFHHCVFLSIQTPFCSFCCFIIVLLSQLQVLDVVLSSCLRSFRIKVNKYNCIFLIFLYQFIANVLMSCIY